MARSAFPPSPPAGGEEGQFPVPSLTTRRLPLTKDGTKASLIQDGKRVIMVLPPFVNRHSLALLPLPFKQGFDGVIGFGQFQVFEDIGAVGVPRGSSADRTLGR